MAINARNLKNVNSFGPTITFLIFSLNQKLSIFCQHVTTVVFKVVLLIRAPRKYNLSLCWWVFHKPFILEVILAITVKQDWLRHSSCMQGRPYNPNPNTSGDSYSPCCLCLQNLLNSPSPLCILTFPSCPFSAMHHSAWYSLPQIPFPPPRFLATDSVWWDFIKGLTVKGLTSSRELPFSAQSLPPFSASFHVVSPLFSRTPHSQPSWLPTPRVFSFPYVFQIQLPLYFSVPMPPWADAHEQILLRSTPMNSTEESHISLLFLLPHDLHKWKDAA